jgi:SAM-dependent methyltransferase
MTWSGLAELWVRTWAGFTEPARRVVAERAAIGPGTRVLDLGCGSGELLALCAGRGAAVAGIDAAAPMIAVARERLPDADLRVGAIEDLPWGDTAFDVAVAINSVQYAEDRGRALAEARRVTRPGGLVAVCAWGADESCEVEAVAIALEGLASPEPPPRGRRLGEHGVLEGLLPAAGLEIVSAEDVSAPYAAPDEEELQEAFRLDAVLTGALDAAGEDAVRATIARAAARFRRDDGSYRFENVLRVVIARA